MIEVITDEVKEKLIALGITDEDDMLAMCNGLDAICEIGYTIYNNKRYNGINDD